MDHSSMSEFDRTQLAMELAMKAVHLSQSGVYLDLADKFAERAESLLAFGSGEEEEK